MEFPTAVADGCGKSPRAVLRVDVDFGVGNTLALQVLTGLAAIRAPVCSVEHQPLGCHGRD